MAGGSHVFTLHSVIAGTALAASVFQEKQSPWAGFSVFLLIFFHKPLDSMTLGTLMAVGGWSRMARHMVNFLFALAAIALAMWSAIAVRIKPALDSLQHGGEERSRIR